MCKPYLIYTAKFKKLHSMTLNVIWETIWMKNVG